MNRAELIEALEKAEGPSKQLDFDIAGVLGLVPNHTVREVGFDYDWYRSPDNYTLWKALDSEGRRVASWSAKPYTSSIDAALTLVPDGALWGVDNDTPGSYPYGATRYVAWCYGKDATSDVSPAIALCIAALKAMEQSDE